MLTGKHMALVLPVKKAIETSLEKVAVKHLLERGVFHTNLFTARLCTRKARPAGAQRIYGKDIVVKGKPEKRTLKLLPTKILKQKCM